MQALVNPKPYTLAQVVGGLGLVASQAKLLWLNAHVLRPLAAVMAVAIHIRGLRLLRQLRLYP